MFVLHRLPPAYRTVFTEILQPLEASAFTTPIQVERRGDVFLLDARVEGRHLFMPLAREWLDEAGNDHTLRIAIRLFRRRLNATKQHRRSTSPASSVAGNKRGLLRPGYLS